MTSQPEYPKVPVGDARSTGASATAGEALASDPANESSIE